jgi:hypothetical protein
MDGDGYRGKDTRPHTQLSGVALLQTVLQPSNRYILTLEDQKIQQKYD